MRGSLGVNQAHIFSLHAVFGARASIHPQIIIALLPQLRAEYLAGLKMTPLFMAPKMFFRPRTRVANVAFERRERCGKSQHRFDSAHWQLQNLNQL